MMHGKRSSQLDPAIPPRQRHISGPMRLPPRRHFGLHTAGRRNCYQPLKLLKTECNQITFLTS